MEIDTQSIQDAIALAGDTGASAQKVAKALETVKGLFGSAKSGTDPDVKLAMSELMLQVANTQATNAQLIQRLTALESELKAAQAKQTDFDRYELWKAPTGRVVYRLKETDNTREPEHFLCPKCIENDSKMILQGATTLTCPACKSRFPIVQQKPGISGVAFIGK